MKNILVTGATGFVGSFLCRRLLEDGWSVRGTMLPSEQPSALLNGVNPVVVAPLGLNTEWAKALIDIDVVIHLAARVHIMNDTSADPLAEFRKVNTEGTQRLAEEAARAGVKRLVYISSIKVNGEECETPYSSDSPANPSDPYGISKGEAEQALRKIEAETGMDVVVIRPTLVYGPGVKGNFFTMMKALSGKLGNWIVDFGLRYFLIIPFASINNKRSLIYVGNLVDAILACTVHPNASGQTYLVSDSEDVSTPELIRLTAAALGVPLARLLPFPTPLIYLIGKVTGNSAAVKRLTGSLTIDSSKIKRELGWQPPFTMEEGLRTTVQWFEKTCR